MKKIIISFAAIIFLVASTYSQSYRQNKPLRLGLHFSPNLGYLSPETRSYENDGVSLGYSYGLISDFSITENYYVGSGLFISHFGGKVNMPGTEIINDDEVEVTHWRSYNLQYLNIPLTLKLLTNEIGYTTFLGQFGVGLGANIGAKGEDKFFADNYERIDNDPDIKSDIAFLRASLIIGGAIEYSLAENASIIIGIEYNNGFTNLITSKPDNVDKHSITTNYIQLTFGVMF